MGTGGQGSKEMQDCGLSVAGCAAEVVCLGTGSVLPDGANAVWVRCGVMQSGRGLAWCLTACRQQGYGAGWRIGLAALACIHSGQPVPCHIVFRQWLAWLRDQEGWGGRAALQKEVAAVQ